MTLDRAVDQCFFFSPEEAASYRERRAIDAQIFAAAVTTEVATRIIEPVVITAGPKLPELAGVDECE